MMPGQFILQVLKVQHQCFQTIIWTTQKLEVHFLLLKLGSPIRECVVTSTVIEIGPVWCHEGHWFLSQLRVITSNQRFVPSVTSATTLFSNRFFPGGCRGLNVLGSFRDLRSIWGELIVEGGSSEDMKIYHMAPLKFPWRSRPRASLTLTCSDTMSGLYCSLMPRSYMRNLSMSKACSSLMCSSSIPATKLIPWQ